MHPKSDDIHRVSSWVHFLCCKLHFLWQLSNNTLLLFSIAYLFFSCAIDAVILWIFWTLLFPFLLLKQMFSTFFGHCLLYIICFIRLLQVFLYCICWIINECKKWMGDKCYTGGLLLCIMGVRETTEHRGTQWHRRSLYEIVEYIIPKCGIQLDLSLIHI